MSRKNLTLSILLSLVIFASVGICACILSNRCGCRLDITENRLYTLSEQTETVLDGLDCKVTLTVFDLKTDYPAIVRNLLESYSSASKNIDVVYCDPFREPRKVHEIKEKGFNVSQSDIAVQSEDGTRLLTLDSLYKLGENGNSVECLMAEQQITSAISAVVNPQKGRVLFTDGHGETPSESLMSLFDNNHYNTSFAELSVLGIPEDTTLIVICAPQKDISAQEMELLSEYMNRGGAVLCFVQPETAGLNRLAGFLAERGIGLTDDIVKEPSLCLSGNELSVVATYSGHEINTFFSQNRVYVVTPSSSALEQLYVKQGRTETRSVLRSSSESYTSADTVGSRELCISSHRTSTDSTGRDVEQRLVVVGSKLVYADDLLGESKLANRAFILQAVSWLVGDEELLNIPARNLKTDILPATTHLSNMYIAIMVVGVPLTILMAGFIVFFKRRYL